MGTSRIFPGVYRAVVTAAGDPRQSGRVKVKIPAVLGQEEVWAQLLVQGRRAFFVPEPDDEVLVAFEAGEPRSPVILGTLWDGSDPPPEHRRAS
jgi:uncharacterized protein involved in type VI secretion and phage assembly